ncbi:MAG: 50S ribosomal protein L11 methyltransferase, partial [Thiotrichaceae bacterium]
MSEQRWLQLVCYTQDQNLDAIENAMEDANALSITLQDAFDTPVLEPLPGEIPLWKDLIVTALFDYDTNLTELSELLRNNRQQWNIEKFLIETVEDQDWDRVWMKDFHPMRFGKNLWIYPSNHDIPNNKSTKILLDPGLAFGTGTHPTTALCLEWLD